MYKRIIKKALLISIWFGFLTFPLVALHVDFLEKSIRIKWDSFQNVLSILFGIILIWLILLEQKKKKLFNTSSRLKLDHYLKEFLRDKTRLRVTAFLLALIVIVLPRFISSYYVSIYTTAMMYIILGLGLNIVVGVAGLLDLGYVAFFAVGAYSYALMNIHFHAGFWLMLPVGGMLAAIAGVILGIPVLKLRGDYLAIVTLGFGEIIRLLLENVDSITNGPSGIPAIPKPDFLNFQLGFSQSVTFVYYITFCFVIIAILVSGRLMVSRVGRAWRALREDEQACQAMGINTTSAKLLAFGTGAFWSGIVGVIFAAKVSFINPSSFTFHESAIILAIVVFGGMGSIIGVIIAAIVLILLPEYLRYMADYRMLIFGAMMVVMMIFKPEGLISNVRYRYDSST